MNEMELNGNKLFNLNFIHNNTFFASGYDSVYGLVLNCLLISSWQAP